MHVHVAHKVVAFFMHIQEGYTPLFSASQEGHDGIVEMLLQAGASVDLQAKVSIDVTNFDPKKSLKEISQHLTEKAEPRLTRSFMLGHTLFMQIP